MTDQTGGNGHQMYHLPLLPGYGPAAKVHSSVPTASHTCQLSHMSQVEEDRCSAQGRRGVNGNINYSKISFI